KRARRNRSKRPRDSAAGTIAVGHERNNRSPSGGPRKRLAFDRSCKGGRAEVLSIAGSPDAYGRQASLGFQPNPRERLGDLTENHERQVGMSRHGNFLLFVTLAM